MTLIPQNRDRLLTAAAGNIIARGMPPKRIFARRSGRLLAVGLIATLVPGGVAVSQLRSDDAPEPALPELGADRSGDVPDRPALAEPPVAQREAFAVLLRTPTDADRDNAAVRGIAKYARQFGLQPRAARVLTERNGNRVWLIPGNTYMCVGIQPAGLDQLSMGCNTEMRALVDGLNTSDGATVTGILPDGIDYIDVRAVHTTATRRVPVSNNTYTIDGGASIVSYSIAGQVRNFRLAG